MRLKIIRVKNWMGQGFISPINRAMEEIKELGYIFDENPDYTCIQLGAFNADSIYEEIERAKSPVMILEFLNGTVIRWKELLDNPKVVGYIKGQVPKNAPKNIHLGWNMGLIKMAGNDYTDNRTFFNNERDIDIHFSMVIKNYDNTHLTRQSSMSYLDHRMRAKNAVNRVCKKYGLVQSGKCKGKEYREKMKRSKVCISPWGCGEICHRTFEAIRLGAIPICPDMSYMETWPNVIVPWETYVPCKHDFSNLGEVILETVKNYDKYKVIARNAYKIMKNAWNNEIFAKRFDMVMKGVKNEN